MKNKTVSILLSTYNGEKYLEEQLQSIFNQTYWENCTLFVRDDGSTDNTISILKKYEKEGKLILNQGENIGFCKSFFWLVKNAPESDYYGFADQDDIWNSNKIERAVSVLENGENEKPLLYFTDFAIADGDGNIVNEHYKCVSLKPTFLNSMTMNQASGFTMLFNDKLRFYLSKVEGQKGQYHDYWAYLIALGFGNVMHDDFVCAKYRRHGKNESDFFKGLGLLKARIRNFILNNKKNSNFTVLKDMKNLFFNEFSSENLYIIELFINYSFISCLKKCFFKGRYRKFLFEDFALRVLLLLGRF